MHSMARAIMRELDGESRADTTELTWRSANAPVIPARRAACDSTRAHCRGRREAPRRYADDVACEMLKDWFRPPSRPLKDARRVLTLAAGQESSERAAIASPFRSRVYAARSSDLSTSNSGTPRYIKALALGIRSRVSELARADRPVYKTVYSRITIRRKPPQIL